MKRAATITFASVVAVGLTLCVLGPVRADTDYRCLSDCLNNGGGASGGKCLASCTYQSLVAPTRPRSEFQSLHNQFVAPTPTSQIFVNPPAGRAPVSEGTPAQSLSPTTQPLGPSTNFTCVHNCLTIKGYQYGMCVAGCSY